MKKTTNRRKTTRLQARQRELAWALYIAEGYIANVAAGLERNSSNLEPSDMRVVEAAVVSVVEAATKLRVRLGRLG